MAKFLDYYKTNATKRAHEGPAKKNKKDNPLSGLPLSVCLTRTISSSLQKEQQKRSSCRSYHA